MREDRLSLLEQDGLEEAEAIANEFRHGMRSLAEVQDGLERFRAGAGRHGSFEGALLSNLPPGEFHRVPGRRSGS